MQPTSPATSTETASLVPQLSLLGAFTLQIANMPVSLPIQACRVLAYLALDRMIEPDCERELLAERLWLDVPAARSHASLRTALWRIRKADTHLVHVARNRVRLDDLVEVDVYRSRAQAMRLLSDDPWLRPTDTQVASLVSDLLPSWDEDWLTLERERIRQMRVHALEALTHRLHKLGRYPQAIDVAFKVIADEPLRESAHAALIDVYLAEGNVAEAHTHLRKYATLLWNELRLRPSPGLLAHVGVSQSELTSTAAQRSRPGRGLLRLDDALFLSLAETVRDP
jgi:DNA-binding SARP family transcriptional activator